MDVETQQLTADSALGIDFGIVLVAAGRGFRAADSGCTKQFRLIGGRAILSRTTRALRRWSAHCPIIIVHHADDTIELAKALSWRDENIHYTTGGSTRQESTLSGLKLLASLNHAPSHVLIHDAVRPFISSAVLDKLRLGLVAEPNVGLIPAIPITDTVRCIESNGIIEPVVARGRLYRSQTPQAFLLSSIISIHERLADLGVINLTDDASAFEWAGLPVRVVPGDPRNLKITYPEDFLEGEQIAKAIDAEQSAPDVRVGHGYDAHQLVSGGKMVLCGVEVSQNKSLIGHSDADAGLHALTDAILATIGAGDIGQHFPATAPRWRSESSNTFLKYANLLVKSNGGFIRHCDVTLVCEEPRIEPHREAMRDFIGATLSLDKHRVSIKATSNERMGFVGRGEGIVAFANATAVF